ncbi:GNAT family N-acetyltransferase [Gorillibacterium timonense]|uniref:GNAT family N-acetyltransferase n=1 Tax=Gorillibacterium timonense TaxID=1689269 RepID=UPI00071C4333|nr:GNAT family protein [Gorillibacterium timonense]
MYEHHSHEVPQPAPSNSVHLRPFKREDAEELLKLRIASRTQYEAFQPARDDSYYTLSAQREEIEEGLFAEERGMDYTFGIFRGPQEELVGRIRLSAVHRGVWLNANVGYFVGTPYAGQGYATEAVRLAAAFAFREAGLHRLQAAVMPWNAASLRVMEKAGFRREGLAVRYLNINGVWEDHVLFAMTAEEYQ